MKITIYRTFDDVEHKIAEVTIQELPDDIEELVWNMGGDRHTVEEIGDEN